MCAQFQIVVNLNLSELDASRAPGCPLSGCPSTRNLVRGVVLMMTVALHMRGAQRAHSRGLMRARKRTWERTPKKDCVVSSDVRNCLSNNPPAMPVILSPDAIRDVTASAMCRFRERAPYRAHQGVAQFCPGRLVAPACAYGTTQRWCGLSGSCNWCISALLRVLTLIQSYLF
ncbi:uncharacterized protein M421DRAFT_124081 [Didymella exigua CBS 183.55]|uniref:Uncharacterized protein n=1 Tax=Didymella exigua CBS 183.55 TaxID=1150837 RepID=A0A6A5RQG9_9PLEO|nr:uncharacterized protein M421DRAFT_124081 [Didymella exigua CBS 183.55]KAF1929570.1 hypothetical protein M421DRAFT_124081 [Didymella exigua CBS 183.55]